MKTFKNGPLCYSFQPLLGQNVQWAHRPNWHNYRTQREHKLHPSSMKTCQSCAFVVCRIRLIFMSRRQECSREGIHPIMVSGSKCQTGPDTLTPSAGVDWVSSGRWKPQPAALFWASPLLPETHPSCCFKYVKAAHEPCGARVVGDTRAPPRFSRSSAWLVKGHEWWPLGAEGFCAWQKRADWSISEAWESEAPHYSKWGFKTHLMC